MPRPPDPAAAHEVLPLILLLALLAIGGALVLYVRVERAGRAGIPLAALRAAAWLGVALLLVDPGCRGPVAPPTVLLDGSASMSDPTGDVRWRAAVDSARALAAGGGIVVFGNAPRAWSDSARPMAPATVLLPVLREAVSRGGPVVVVSDGEVDDAAALPPDLLRVARVVILPRPSGPDAGVVAVRLPAVLRSGDSATAEVDVAVRGASPGDSANVELREGGRVVARARVALGAGAARAALPFVPAPSPGERAVRRYEARLTGLARDVEPRDDAGETASLVVRAATVALFSESPDWDFRALARVLRSARATPVRSFVRVADGVWRDAITLAPVSDAAVRATASSAALVVAHGPDAALEPIARAAHGSLWRWLTGGAVQAADWYASTEPGASPVGGALAGVPAESLPPLSSLRVATTDSTAWSALPVRAGRRGQARPAIVGGVRDGRRWIDMEGTGLWRWVARGGVANEAYRSLVFAAADWLLERRAPDEAGVVALRDSLARVGGEYLPRAATLAAQTGSGAALRRARVPLQEMPRAYVAVLAVLCVEWVARRRKGMR